MNKEKKVYIIFQKKCKDTDITFRKWINEERVDFLVDDNAAKFLGYKNKECFINAIFDKKDMEYNTSDKIWIEWNEHDNIIKSVTISKTKEIK